ncbi:methyl-accepting chemotaxis protein [Pantanalinema rosaneae CENA516]|uniref:methyl-accepting chemotaxis protein n=1 Tax=Pantanalinema rosaneae TaxID=1620701 RepID=UPI003D6FA3BA
MASSTEYAQEYHQAQKAYMQGNYEDAAQIIDRLVQHFPSDPSACLLRGHIYCYGLQQFDVAREQYQTVMGLTSDPEFTGYANQGLEYIESLGGGEENGFNGSEVNEGSEVVADFDAFDDQFDDFNQQNLADFSASTVWQSEEELTPDSDRFDVGNLDSHDNGRYGLDADDAFASPSTFDNPFAEDNSFGASGDVASPFSDPFADENAAAFAGLDSEYPPFPETPDFSTPDFDSPNFETPDFSTPDFSTPDFGTSVDFGSHEPAFGTPLDEFDDAFAPLEEPLHPDLGAEEPSLGRSSNFGSPRGGLHSPTEEETLFMGGTNLYDEGEQTFVNPPSTEPLDSSYGRSSSSYGSYGSSLSDGDSGGSSQGVDFLDEFDEFDDLGNLSDFDLSENSAGFTSPAMGADFGSSSAALASDPMDFNGSAALSDRSIIRDEEVFTLSGTSDQVPAFTQLDSHAAEPTPSVEQGWLSFLENSPLAFKQVILAGVTGITSAILVALVSFFTAQGAAQQDDAASRGVIDRLKTTGWLMALTAGVASGGATFALGQITAKQMKRSTDDLQSQFNSVCQGNLNARATVYSEDEFGQLATSFNQMARVILTTTSEAQRKAEEQEQAKEDLQRQVIRLLDDVEGAARGDLTVQAEVTADVLGAVADSFNLTIQNLREIVQQVKIAARQVTKGATDNEMFARGLSSDALRQAEELAVTLNSVQVMTESIQRVAESAREAEEVARSASETALRGGEAVERTVAGILQIRETVAETTRKVKRLAESSQEISKIVALISQIASRTNLLALNASIEAARAGEAGRGFAIVADEVRQLADRAAKNSKEIEQIVLQIQSETGSVMTAMEEGTQQVIEGTRLAEQAKRSLEDIIQVSNRIDVLVRSITADTVEQTETSRAVAQVMQSVELTAQETSQEAQRVSASLQNLVGVARDLLTSVERFRVETVERQ